MEDWFVEWEQLSSRPEVEFLGVVIDVRHRCNCEYCKKGERVREERGSNRAVSQLHLVVAPVNMKWRLQHIYIDMSSTSQVSRKGCWIHAMTVLRIPFKTKEEFEKFMKRTVIRFRKTTVGDYLKAYARFTDAQLKQFTDTAVNAQVILPVQIIPKDALELEGLTAEEVKEKVKLYKKVWQLILKGVPEDEAYKQVFGELAEELEREMEKSEETEETTETTEETEEVEEEEFL